MKQDKTQDIVQILDGEKLVATISAPEMNYSYQVHPTKWSAVQRRPKVTLKKAFYNQTL